MSGAERSVPVTWSLVCSLLVGVGCASAPAVTTATPAQTTTTQTATTTTTATTDPVLTAIYDQALDQAKNPTPQAVYDQLIPITPDTPKLEWRDIDGEPHVLVASWTSSFKYYESSLGKPYNTGTHDIWVSAAPFVQELCTDPAWRGDDLDMRLRQLIGLPPDGQYIGFAEFWVKPEDLFRPCPDNEITDTVCGLSLPDDVDDAYRRWFNDLRSVQYFVSKDPSSPGWPWTQLGYTFDWHDLTSPVGVSEYVIAQGSTVVVNALVPTATYCGVE